MKTKQLKIVYYVCSRLVFCVFTSVFVFELYVDIDPEMTVIQACIIYRIRTFN